MASTSQDQASGDVIPKASRKVVGLVDRTRREKITKKLISSTEVPVGERLTIRDTDTPGLELRISGGSRGGVKRWSVKYRVRGQAEQKRMKLGVCPPIDIDKARELAGAAKSMAANGEDPQLARLHEAAERQAKRVARVTVATMLRRYAAEGIRGTDKDHKKTVAQWFERYVIPAKLPGSERTFGERFIETDLNDVTAGDVNAVVVGIKNSGIPTTANRVLSQLKNAWKWALVPFCDQLTSNIATPVRKPYEGEKDNEGRALDTDELTPVWKASERLPAAFRDSFRVMLLTGQRREEVCNLRLSAVNLETGVWKQAKWENKAKRRHHLTLPATALEILRRIDRERGGMKPNEPFFVWNGKGIYGPWSTQLKKMRRWVDQEAKRELERWGLHSLRHTVRTGLSASGVDEHIAELVINHAIDDEMQKRYGHHHFLEQIAEALAAWERHLLAIVEKKALLAPQKRLRAPAAG
jgi:integrase